ncbi:TPA: mechanosensitive ion channel family protein, partial [Methanocaldococcus jannaschii]|nr:mechanosensitive ion channel family protein [Methanocaldococcus jannaschii]
MEIFGNSISNILIFVVITLLGIFIGKIVDKIVRNYLKKIIDKTKTKFDDIILESIDLPIIVLVVTLFFYFGLRFLILPDYILKLIDEAVKVVVILSATYFAVKFI